MSISLFPQGFPLSKRIFDLVLVIPGLILISPILLLASLVLYLTQGSPILFRQDRPGYKGKIFTIYKFRTMRDALDKNGNPLPDSRRLTSLGKFLRATSLDELPELFNVLRGEMSLVGPRPLLVSYLEHYTPEQARRHDVYPGLTGWAQINGRNILSWDEKFKLDVWYVDNWSLGLDVKILLLTPWTVFRQEGISQRGHSTARKFKGSRSSRQNKEK